MSGEWIKMRSDLYRDLDVIRISQLTCPKLTRESAHRYGIIGRLHSLWAYADEQTSDGFLRGLMPKHIDEMVDLEGLASAMIEVGWLKVVQVESTQGIKIVHFRKHFPFSTKRRMQEYERKKRYEESGKRPPKNPDALPTFSRRFSDEKSTRNAEEQQEAELCNAAGEKSRAKCSAEQLRILEQLGILPKVALEVAGDCSEACVSWVLEDFHRRIKGSGKKVHNPPGLLVQMLRQHHGCSGVHAQSKSASAKERRDQHQRLQQELFGIPSGQKFDDLAEEFAIQPPPSPPGGNQS
jgi:hypothetical protein